MISICGSSVLTVCEIRNAKMTHRVGAGGFLSRGKGKCNAESRVQELKVK